jgi:competence protein ComEC
MKKVLFSILLGLLIFCFAGSAQATPQVILDDKTLTFDVPPTIENDRTLVPLRAIFEALGANVQWDGVTQTVTATKDDIEIKLIIGGQAYKNGAPVTLDVPAKIINDRTMVPLRFVSEAFGCQVAWDGSTQTITITSANLDGAIKVHFIDVGQADAIFIDLPNNDDILIDAGNKADGALVVNYLKNQGVDDIDLLIATHPHEDHIGGIPAVLNAFQVERIIDSGKAADSAIYQEYASDAAAEGADWEQSSGQTFTFGNNTLQILTSAGHSWDNLNDYSVVSRLDTGNIEFLFMGDAGFPAESVLSGELDADILKVGHHGSSTSTSAALLRQVSPQVAVISVGAGNTYGHPTVETLQRLQNAGATIYRTDLNGTIVVTTDGSTYSIASSGDKTAAEPISIYQPQETTPTVTEPSTTATTGAYVGSIKSDKYHYPSCRYAEKISPDNMVWFQTVEEAQAAGYQPCGVCKP